MDTEPQVICIHLCGSMICFFRAVLLNALILDAYLQIDACVAKCKGA
jgi:hypothetical protein